jgi:anti-sigma factor RsiW
MAETLEGTELTCRQIIDFVQAFLDGELPPREQTIFELHLSICPDCVNYLRSYQATRALSKLAGEEEPTESPIPEDLIQAILAARKNP